MAVLTCAKCDKEWEAEETSVACGSDGEPYCDDCWDGMLNEGDDE